MLPNFFIVVISSIVIYDNFDNWQIIYNGLPFGLVIGLVIFTYGLVKEGKARWEVLITAANSSIFSHNII